MPSSPSSLTSRWVTDTGAVRFLWRAGPILVVHVAALIILFQTEYHDVPSMVAFALTWALINFVWLMMFRRPGVAAVLSLTMIVVLIQVSKFKYSVIWQTVSFVDLMVIDSSSVSYLLALFPGLTFHVLLGLAVAVAALLLLWRFDPVRIRRRLAVVGAVACLLGLGVLSITHPFLPEDIWVPQNHVSNFARSGADAIIAYARGGYLDSDAAVTDRLKTNPAATCEPAGKPPHIIMVHDESAFDVRSAPNIRVPQGYGDHFRSFDGKQRGLIVEAAGGPSWYTEYNVFAGLSARSFGRFSYFVTRIAAGRVQRGLPNSLRRCGYRTFSLYPAHGAFMGARTFQASTGVQNFFDMKAMRAHEVEPDSFYYDAAIKMFERERSKGPTFFFVYLSANHFPWDHRWRPDLTPEWKDLGNRPVVDEYLRRQTLGMRQYQQFLQRLRLEFPGERFMLVRYGDHQPDFATKILEPSLDDDAVVERLMAYDPKYYTTYYAIDAINYRPVNISSALSLIEGPYLPMVVLESAGLPLDPSFAEQKQIFERCRGLFYGCANGAEARRFNRMLIDAGLIKKL
jgi:phosphoglycerol transferase MdoB-like AlkP superfamily enzyme